MNQTLQDASFLAASESRRVWIYSLSKVKGGDN
jgi:hypothetical protein